MDSGAPILAQLQRTAPQKPAITPIRPFSFSNESDMNEKSSNIHFAQFPFMIDMPTVLTNGYEHLHHQEANVALKTISRHSLALGPWHTAISLIIQSVSGALVFEGTDIERASKSLRVGFAVSATHTSKVAMDLCLGGHYPQAMMMCRYLVESWIRVAYLELQPNAARNWFRHGQQKPQPTKNPKMLKRLEDHPAYRANATIARQLIEEANHYSHPSPEAIAHAYQLGREHKTLGTVYMPNLVGNVIHIAATSCFLIAQELPRFVTVSESFADTLDRVDRQMQAWEHAQQATYNLGLTDDRA